MFVKRILSYSHYQLKNQLRGMSVKSKLFWGLDWLDALLQPIFFSTIFLMVNPSYCMILMYGTLPLLFNIINGLETTQQLNSKGDAKKNFQIIGLSNIEYAIGIDLIYSMRTIVSNIIYSISIVIVSFFHYPSVFLSVLLTQLVLLILLPFIFICRYHLLVLSKKILFVLSRLFTYQSITIFILIVNIRKLVVNSNILVAILFFVSIGICLLLIAKKIIGRTNLKSNNCIMELRIALNESNFSLYSMLFINLIWIVLSIYLMKEFRVAFNVADYGDLFNIIGLAYVYIPLTLISFIHISLSYYYGYDLEGNRMLKERYLGDFIRHKVKNKMYLSYMLSFPCYILYLLGFIIFCSTSISETLKYLVAYFLGIILQPLIFFIGTLLFPNYKRSFFDLDQQTSTFSLFFSLMITSLISLMGAYYAWKTETIISINTIYFLLIDIVIATILGIIAYKRTIQLGE